MTIYVCSERDIECGDNRSTWCESCPKRKTNDVKIPLLPDAIWPYNVGSKTYTADQMHAFYLQGYNDGRNAPHVLGAGLDPWPNSGDPVIADELRAPDDAVQPEHKPLTDEQIEALVVLWMPGDPYSEINIIATARAIEAAHGIGEKS